MEERYSIRESKKWTGKNDLVRSQLFEWYGGDCQICGKSFLKKDGNPYYEGVYLVSYTRSEWIDRVGNVLCLCPWHSAMLQFGPIQYDTDLLEQIEAFVPEGEGGRPDSASILLTLCDDELEIRFHENHLLELQVMVRESRKTKK